jgi:hypothetical protein
MNDYGRRYLIERLGRHSEHDDWTEHDRRDRRDYSDYEDERDYEDGRRGVRGSGMRRRSSMRRRDYMDEADYGDKPLRLTKSDMAKLKHEMENADGTHGEHYTMDEIMRIAEKLGIKFNEFSEKQLCLATNIMYSDYCKVLKKHLPQDELLMTCVEMGEAYLDDPDGLDPDEKLAVHYHCMMNFE